MLGVEALESSEVAVVMKQDPLTLFAQTFTVYHEGGLLG